MTNNVIELRSHRLSRFTDAEWRCISATAAGLAATLRQQVTIETGAGEQGEEWAALLLGDPDADEAPVTLLSVVKTGRTQTAALLDGKGGALATGRTVADLFGSGGTRVARES